MPAYKRFFWIVVVFWQNWPFERWNGKNNWNIWVFYDTICHQFSNGRVNVSTHTQKLHQHRTRFPTNKHTISATRNKNEFSNIRTHCSQSHTFQFRKEQQLATHKLRDLEQRIGAISTDNRMNRGKKQSKAYTDMDTDKIYVNEVIARQGVLTSDREEILSFGIAQPQFVMTMIWCDVVLVFLVK